MVQWYFPLLVFPGAGVGHAEKKAEQQSAKTKPASKANVAALQGDQIGRNFAIWAIFYGVGRIFFLEKVAPMIWAKF